MPDVQEIIDRLLDQMFGAPLPTGDPGRRFGVVHFEDAEAAVLAAFAAGRAAATDTIPREDALQALHEMSTVAGLLRIREDDPAVVALGDRLRLACRALRDVTAPGMNELMDSQPGRAAATPDPPDDLTRTWTGTQLTPGHETRTSTGNPYPTASPDERLREAVRDFLDGVFEGDGRWDRLHAALAAADREKPDEPKEKP